MATWADRLGHRRMLVAGTLKIAYDVLLHRSFRAVRPPEERDGENGTTS